MEARSYESRSKKTNTEVAATFKSVSYSQNITVFRSKVTSALRSLTTSKEVLSLFDERKKDVDPVLLPRFLSHPSLHPPSPSDSVLPMMEGSLEILKRSSPSPVSYSQTMSALNQLR